MNVSVVIPTRGNVSLLPVLGSLPVEWERIVWDNGHREVRITGGPNEPRLIEGVPDLSVYARYAAIEHASCDLILTQDDDVIVSDPQAIVDRWLHMIEGPEIPYDEREFVVCNMPQEFRHDFYSDHALVGFGAAFHRDAPKRAFERFAELPGWGGDYRQWGRGDFHRDCDLIFTALTPRVLVDVPKQNLPWAENDDRLYRQRDHQAKRDRMLELALKVRDA